MTRRALLIAAAAITLVGCGKRIIRIPCVVLGCQALPTPTPPVVLPPVELTPTPTPTPTCPPGFRLACSSQIMSSGAMTGCTCEPAPPPPVPDVCPCAVIWGSGLFFSLDENHLVVPAPVVGGTVVIDSTLAFARYSGDGRGGPCNGEHDACSGRACDPIAHPLWTMTPDLPSCEAVSQGETCYLLDGHQLQIRRLAPGRYDVHSGFPSNLVDQGNPPRAISQCGWAPGPTRSDRVTFTVGE